MSSDRPEQPSDPDETGVVEPADPFEPEAPAHVNPDEETAVHHDEGTLVDGADPAPDQPADGEPPA